MLGSVGNNLNNRMEEGIGTAVDFQFAGEAGLLGERPPWVAYAYVMQDLAEAKRAVPVWEPHFPIDPAFEAASYEKRMELYLQRLVMKKVYDAAWFVIGDPEAQTVTEPCDELTWAKFEAAIRGRVAVVLA